MPAVKHYKYRCYTKAQNCTKWTHKTSDRKYDTNMGTCNQTALVLSWPCTATLCLFDPVESRNTKDPYYHPDNEQAQACSEIFYL